MSCVRRKYGKSVNIAVPSLKIILYMLEIMMEVIPGVRIQPGKV